MVVRVVARGTVLNVTGSTAPGDSARHSDVFQTAVESACVRETNV